MHFNLAAHPMVLEAMEEASQAMAEWECQHVPDTSEVEQIRKRITFFPHCTTPSDFSAAGVDGTGDYPSLSYSDSLVYVSVAQATLYKTAPIKGLQEVQIQPVNFDICWMPSDKKKSEKSLLSSFANLSGAGSNDPSKDPDVEVSNTLLEIIKRSDYKKLKAKLEGVQAKDADNEAEKYLDSLILPNALDTGNIAIQLRSVAELGAAYKLLKADDAPDYLLLDTTLSLATFGGKGTTSLFAEHLKRACCTLATDKGKGLFGISKSHGLRAIETLEAQATSESGGTPGTTAEHWFLRLPLKGHDEWDLSLVSGKRYHPPGAVSYVVRFHKQAPILRLDMDINYWLQKVQGDSDEATKHNERELFSNLDFLCHDQRSIGYPYPIKACHDRVSLTQTERNVLRKQLIDVAVSKGMSRKLFTDAALLTGHK